MIVQQGSRVRVLWGPKAQPGVVKHVFKGVDRTRYHIELDSGRCLTTTIDGILEP